MYEHSELLEQVNNVLEALRPSIEANTQFSWGPADGFRPLILRSVFVRQTEFLAVTTKLVDMHVGYAAAPFLRAACEELLWTSYFGKIGDDATEELVRLLVKRELTNNLEAQAGFATNEAMCMLGLTGYLNAFRTSAPARADHLKEVGRRLGWPNHVVLKGQLPSTYFIARATNHQDLYAFLYHGSSRYVHFSVAELLRRTWARDGQVAVGSHTFSSYWAEFALFWGLYLFFETVAALPDDISISEHLSPEAIETIDTLARAIGDRGQIPIITEEELLWE